jgi:hypothetical protein
MRTKYDIKGGITIFGLAIIIISCSGKKSSEPAEELLPNIKATIDLVIGAVEQPLEYQLGRPHAVLSDVLGNIFVADRASLEIKIFDRNGTYLKSIGGRGRGPGEFQDIELLGWTQDGNLVVMDRGLLQYVVISTEGELVEAYPINLADQFYPKAIKFLSGKKIVALFFRSSTSSPIPRTERNLFYIYSTDFQQRESSFFPINKLGLVEDGFPVSVLSGNPGSFVLSKEENLLVFSPSTYEGSLYLYRINEDGQWEFGRYFQGKDPRIDPIRVFDSEQQYQRAAESGNARVQRGSSGGKPIMGSQLSVDAGIFLHNDGRIIHFYAEWREGYERLPGSWSHPMDLYVQIFNWEGELMEHSFLFSYIERYPLPYYAVVNWMDDEGNFYMFNNPNDIPTVQRFSLELSE